MNLRKIFLKRVLTNEIYLIKYNCIKQKDTLWKQNMCAEEQRKRRIAGVQECGSAAQAQKLRVDARANVSYMEG